MVSGEDSKSYQIDSQDYTRARSRKNHSFDARWIVILVALVGVFVLAIVYNSSHSGIDASRIETGLISTTVTSILIGVNMPQRTSGCKIR